MKYRVLIDLRFDEEDPCNDIIDKALDHFPEAVTINPLTPVEERGHIRKEICHHDESPSAECEVSFIMQTPYPP